MQVRYEAVYDETHLGRDISIYTHEDGTCTVRVKYPCGELIREWENIKDFEFAISHAHTYVYALSLSSDYRQVHCKNEYCQIDSR